MFISLGVEFWIIIYDLFISQNPFSTFFAHFFYENYDGKYEIGDTKIITVLFLM